MAEEKKEKSGFFKGVEKEFHKIIWPSGNDLVKQSIAVMCASLCVGVIIAFLDLAFQYGVNFLTM